MKTIKIQEDDFLWKFYLLRFEIEGREPVAPKSICPYFWTSVRGLYLYVERRCSPWRLAGASLLLGVALPLLLGLVSAAKDVGCPGALIQVAAFLPVLAVLALGLSFACLFLAVMFRIQKLLEESAGAQVALVSAILLLGGHLFVSDFRGAVAHVGSFFGLAGSLLAAALALLALAGLLAWLARRYPETTNRLKGAAGRLARLFQALAAFAAACKQKVCPPVDSPMIDRDA